MTENNLQQDREIHQLRRTLKTHHTYLWTLQILAHLFLRVKWLPVFSNGKPREGYPLVTASARLYANIAAISIN